MKAELSVLAIEDDVLIQKIYKTVLNQDIELTICGNYEQFLDELYKRDYDIFLVDLGLGVGKDGIQIIKEIRLIDKFINAPIIVVTAYAAKKDENIAMQNGATLFFRKPIDMKILASTIQSFRKELK
ncbi:MAG: response regulator [Melioribacteraceae bacterium]